MANILASLYRLEDAYRDLPEEEKAQLIFIIENLSEACKITSIEGSHNFDRTSLIHQINNYITKKIKENYKNPIEISYNKKYWRRLRNDLVHGSSLKKYSEKEIRYAEKALWEMLANKSSTMDAKLLTNFLDYCLRPSGKPDATDLNPPSVVKYYEDYFYSLPQHEQRRIFEEIAIRLFSDPEIIKYLERD